MRYTFIMLISSVLFFSCNNETNNKTAENTEEATNQSSDVVTFTDEQIKVAEIKTGKLQKVKISQEIYSTGEIEALPQNKAKISVPAAAFVDKIFVKHGAYVKKGQNVIAFKHNNFIDMQANYLKLKNELKFKKEEYERQKNLYEEKAVSKKKFRQVELDYNVALTEKKALEQKLILIGIDPNKLTAEKINSSVNLTAPFSGYIDEVFVSSGQYVEPTDVLFEIINPKGYNIMLNVYAKYRDYIKIGDKVKFRPCDNCKPLFANIYSIGHIVDEYTKTFRVHASPEITDNSKLMSGAYINAKILVNDVDVYALPKSAVINNQDASFVFIENGNNSYKLLKIETGESNKEFVEIKNYDLLSDKQIVISGANYLYAKISE